MKKRSMSAAALMAVGGACLVFAIAGCASAPPGDDPAAVAAYDKVNDPIEPLNRGIFAVNLALDKAVLKPVAFVYKEAVPDPIQIMIGNFLDNLRAPIIFTNELLQGEFGRAGSTLLRFMMNSGFGFIGVADIAAEFGIAKHDEDFGQTAAVWGVGEGFYLMLPFLGPSNPRDAVGKVVDLFIDPFTYLSPNRFNYARFGVGVTHSRAREYDAINRLENTSLDYYAAVRSLYRQRRADAIRNGASGTLQSLPRIPFIWKD